MLLSTLIRVIRLKSSFNLQLFHRIVSDNFSIIIHSSMNHIFTSGIYAISAVVVEA